MPDDPDKKAKPRFKDRDERDDDPDADDRPRKKTRTDDDDADDDPPAKKTRRSDDDAGPRLKTHDGVPVGMLLALIGGALFLLSTCVVGGWWSWVMLVGGGDFGGGGSGDVQVASATRTVNRQRLTTKTVVAWEVRANQTINSPTFVVVLVRCGGETKEYAFQGFVKGDVRSGTAEFAGDLSPAEVWVERRTSASGSATRISDTKTVR